MSVQLFDETGLEQIPTPVESNLLATVVGAGVVHFLAETSNANPAITADTGLDSLVVGALVAGPGIPANTHITNIASGGTVTLSNAATASGSMVALTATPAPGVIPSTAIIILVTAIAAGKTGKQLAFADLTEAGFGGYAASSAVVWGTELYTADGYVFVTGDKKEFRAADNVTPQFIIGAALVDAAKTTLYKYMPFDVPTPGVPMNNLGDGIDFVPMFQFRTIQ